MQLNDFADCVMRLLAVQSEVSRRYRHHIPAPPKPAPGHAESYNPPPEYLFTEHEVRRVFVFMLLTAL